MGIKGIYSEIGPGSRASLAKLAVENIERTGRPLRIAIDVSIWQFQIQSGKGGSNPALRTLYYRLLRLLGLCIQPLFVFDGAHKPPFKRNQKTRPGSASLPNFLTKQLLGFFGFPFHVAPGEAEAECALLQRNGIVDAVLSEDVDTLMFGCGLTFRNWSSEGSRGNHAPTHVSVYDAEATRRGPSGLDREGMILVALMSGGDYITEGVPGCGIKVACEAAKAGFGKTLYKLSNSDCAGLTAWRQKLAHELQSNESKHFRVRHKALKIPDDFPNQEVLGYYTHPVVSSASKISRLKVEIDWESQPDVSELRSFVAEAFDWTGKIGAIKFIRGLAPALLSSKLYGRSNRRASGYDDVLLTEINETALVRSICGNRRHFSTDGIPELRLIYMPTDIVSIDLDAESDDEQDYSRDGLATLGSDFVSGANHSGEDQLPSGLQSPHKKLAAYDPTQPDKLWMPETFVKLGVPLKVEDYAESLRDPIKAYRNKSGATKGAAKTGMKKGALDKFVTVTKSIRSTEVSCTPYDPMQSLFSKTKSPTSRSLTPSFQQALGSNSETLTRLPTDKLGKAADDNARKSLRSTVRDSRKADEYEHTREARARPANPWSFANRNLTTVPGITKPHLTPARSLGKATLTQTDRNSKSSKVDAVLKKHPRPRTPPSPQAPSQPESVIVLNDTPSPSPSKKAARSSQLIGLRTPTSLGRPSVVLIQEDDKVVVDKKVNRYIDFSHTSQPRRSASIDADLPSMEELLSPAPEKFRQERRLPCQDEPDADLPESSCFIRGNAPAVSTKQHSSSPTKVYNASRQKRYLLLRESLEGSWKDMNEDEMETYQTLRGVGKSWRRSEVEVLDMTND